MIDKLKSPYVRIGLGVAAAAIAPAAMAYIGPGAGLGVLGVVLAVLAGIGATLLGLVLLPIRMIKRRLKRSAAVKTSGAETGSDREIDVTKK